MLSGDEAGIVFTQLCNTFEPCDAVAFSSVNRELRASTQALLQQLKADHEAAAAHLCLEVGMRSCKELREAKQVKWLQWRDDEGLSAADLALLGTMGSVLPALKELWLRNYSQNPRAGAGPDGVQRLAEGLGADALPAVTTLAISMMHIGDTGASALAAALGRGALPRLKFLDLRNTAIGDAGLVALAPALRGRLLPALDRLSLDGNPFGDEGLAALVAPPLPAGAPPPPAGGLMKLKTLNLSHTQVNDAGCAALTAALYSGALPALNSIIVHGIPASAAAMAAVQALARLSHEGRRSYGSRSLLTRISEYLKYS